jgi:hypothetical protein
MEVFRPQYRDTELAPHSSRVELRGSPRRLAWPPLCPACGAPAGERLEVAKVFSRRGRLRRGPQRFAVTRVPIPFCASCAARHRTLSAPMSPLTRAFSYVRSGLVITIVCAAGFAAVLVPHVYGTPLPTPTSPGEVQILRFARQLPLFMAALALGALVAMLYQTRRYRVSAQTEVTRSCDFSDDMSLFFEREFHVWRVRDPRFFAAFVEANRGRVVTEGERVVRDRVRSAVFILLVLAAVAAAVVSLAE